MNDPQGEMDDFFDDEYGVFNGLARYGLLIIVAQIIAALVFVGGSVWLLLFLLRSFGVL